MNEMEAARRVIEFLEKCGDADVEADVRYIMHNGGADEIFAFQQGIADAIKLQDIDSQ